MMKSSLLKILSAVSFAVLASMTMAPAHANMDFAMGMATGVSTGSSMGMLGAQVHQSLEEDESPVSSEVVQAQDDRSALLALAVVMIMFAGFLFVMLVSLMF